MTRPPLIILAGGKGSRLRELTEDKVPKPMVDVFGKPFLYWLIKHYSSQGFTEIIINTGYKARHIENYGWPVSCVFWRDAVYISPAIIYREVAGSWIVNGDTFITDTLPYVVEPTILSFRDRDAGAQFIGRGKIQIEPCLGFYDIGTPYGLDRFKQYFKTHPLYLTHLDKK